MLPIDYLFKGGYHSLLVIQMEFKILLWVYHNEYLS